MSHENSITVERGGRHFIESSVEPGKVLEGPFGTQEEANNRAFHRSAESSGSAIFGHADATAAARRAPVEAPPSSFSESLRSAWEVTTETGMSLSASAALYDEYETYINDFYQRGGTRLPNPYASRARDRPKVEAFVIEAVRKARETNPDLPVLDPEAMRAKIGRDRAEARARRAEVAGREIGFAANAGAFLGTAGATMLDPPVLLSMAFGAPWATSLLRAAVIEAGAAGAGEAFAQIGIQGGRRQFGEEADFGEAVTAVGVAAAGAGILAPVVRGGAAGVRALLKRAR